MRADWSAGADKLAALRLGQRLVVEVPASRPGRRAFVDITPQQDSADGAARREGWTRSDTARGFRLEHREYDADRLAGFDYDRGAALVRGVRVEGEEALLAALDAWSLRPDRFDYPWRTDDPR
ncbi:MAG TPA: hypothetical protein VGM10_03405 [Actinocrinis sp.]